MTQIDMLALTAAGSVVRHQTLKTLGSTSAQSGLHSPYPVYYTRTQSVMCMHHRCPSDTTTQAHILWAPELHASAVVIDEGTAASGPLTQMRRQRWQRPHVS